VKLPQLTQEVSYNLDMNTANMKTIGLVGGMSFESSLEYYKLINEQIRKRLGGNNSAKIMRLHQTYITQAKAVFHLLKQSLFH
jgi:aspartate/glutamate racemase